MSKCKQCGTPIVEGISDYCPSCGQEKLEKARERIRAGEAKKRSTYPSGQTPEEPKTPKKSNPMLEAARTYVSQGYSVVPIKKGEKRPAINWDGYQSRIPSDSELCSWFENTDNQIGIVTGNVSGGLFILDFDGENFEESFLEFLEKFPQFQDSLIIKTGSGKYHIYGKCPMLSATRWEKKYPNGHVELRANEHQTLCPPSVHPSGGYYEVFSGTTPVTISRPMLETFIKSWMNQGQVTLEIKDVPFDKKPEGWEKELLEGVSEGERNNAITKLAGRYLGKGLSREEILPILLDVNSKFDPPLDEIEVENTLDSMIKTDEKKNLKSEGKDILKLLLPSDVLAYPDPDPVVTEIPLYLQLLYILSGDGGNYKSVVALSIIKSFLTGEPLFGKYPILKTGPVLLVDEETPYPLLKDRLQKFGLCDDKLPLRLLHFSGLKMDKKEMVNILEQRVDELKPILVVWDSLTRLHNKKENLSTGEMTPVMDAFRRITNKGPMGFIIHHFSKSKDNKSTRGSSDIVNAVDYVFNSLVDNNNLITLQSEKTRYVQFDPIILKPRFSEDSIRVVYEGTEANKISKAIEDILQASGDKMDRTQIESELEKQGVKPVGFGKVLNLLVKSHCINSEKQKVTGVSPNGKSYSTTKWFYWI